MRKVAEIEKTIEFVANVNEAKDCIMSQDKTQEDPGCIWFNIDCLKGHGLKPGDRIRVTIEKLD